MAVTKCNDGKGHAILDQHHDQSIILPSPFAHNAMINNAPKLSFFSIKLVIHLQVRQVRYYSQAYEMHFCLSSKMKFIMVLSR